MRSLNKKAKSIFNKCVAGLNEPGESRRIGNAANGFMPLIVECVATWQTSHIYSLAHYGEQNGDLMCDPEMTFLLGPNGDVRPLTYRNDFVGIDQVAAEPNDETGWKFNQKLQHELCTFAQQWLSNIDEQQDLDQPQG